MEFFLVSLIILILTYYIYRLTKINKNLIIFISLIIEVIISIIFFLYLDITLGLFSLLIMLILISFYLIHLENKLSFIYYLLFYGTILLTSIVTIFNQDLILYIAITNTLVFFLSETNHNYIRKSYEESANEYQNKIIQKQVDEVQNIYLTMRGWRHDYHNHLQTLKAQLTMKQYDMAASYLNDLEKDLSNVNTFVESGNVNLDAILNSKLSLAEKQNIKINYKATVPNKLTVTDLDLCILIGNLFDNAVEACEKITNENKYIRLYIGIFKKQLYISITNSTSEVVRKIDEQYITTKRGNHGHGLKRINNIVNKYEGFINRKNEPGVFVTEIMLPL